MDRSPYLAQALQGMAQAPAQPQMAAPDLAGMARAADARKAWETANPGQNYARRRLGEMVAGVKAAPANVATNLAGLFSLGGR